MISGLYLGENLDARSQYELAPEVGQICHGNICTNHCRMRAVISPHCRENNYALPCTAKHDD